MALRSFGMSAIRMVAADVAVLLNDKHGTATMERRSRRVLQRVMVAVCVYCIVWPISDSEVGGQKYLGV